MPYRLNPEDIARAVYDAVLLCATRLRKDVRLALEQALANESKPRGKRIITQILENDRIAAREKLPLCQDTGVVWVLLELGPDCTLSSNIFSKVDPAVAQAYLDGHLRMSMVKDSLFNRENTQNNTPAFCELLFRSTPGAKLHVMLKGAGSDNASRLVMLAPGSGIEGLKQTVVDTVRDHAAGACPPLLVGVGVGGTFDKAAQLSKRALLRNIGDDAQSPAHAALEEELLLSINALGIGPAALGGTTTALAVSVLSAPSHIAAMPVAINMSCCATRSISFDLKL